LAVTSLTSTIKKILASNEAGDPFKFLPASFNRLHFYLLTTKLKT